MADIYGFDVPDSTEITAQRVWESIHESNKLFSKARHHG